MTANECPEREMLALRLYGELDEVASRALDDHLEACQSCRAFARELETGLGQIVRHAGHETEDDPEWIERLRATTRAEPVRMRRRAAAIFVAGLAAGLAATALLHTASAPSNGGVAGERVVFTERAEAPPRTTSRGQTPALRWILDR